MPRARPRLLPFAPASLLALSAAATHAQEPALLMPPERLLAITCAAPGKALAALRASLPLPPDDLPEETRALLASGLLVLHGMLGKELGPWLDDMAGGGAVFVVFPVEGQPAAGLLLRPDDAAAAAAFFGKTGDRVHARVQDGIVVAGSSDRARDRLLAALAADGTAPPACGPDELAHGVIDFDALRSLPGGDRTPFAGLDAGGRLLVGPWAAALAASKTAELSVRCDRGLRLALRLDGAPSGPWRALLAADGPRTIPEPPTDALAVLALDRSLRVFYQRLADLLVADDVVAAQASLAVLDQIDGRTSFVDDLLGGLREPLTAYLLPTPPPDDAPRLLLPGLAVTAAMADPGVEQILQRAFQLLLLIANGERAQRQSKPFLTTALRGEVHGLCAELQPWRGPGAPPLEHGLSPTLLFGHGHAVLASTRAAAEQTMLAVASGAVTTVDGDLLELRGPAIAAAIAANRAPLQLARMLDEGEDEVAARRFFDVLLAVVDGLHSLRLVARHDGDRLEFALELRGRR